MGKGGGPAKATGSAPSSEPWERIAPTEIGICRFALLRQTADRSAAQVDDRDCEWTESKGAVLAHDSGDWWV